MYRQLGVRAFAILFLVSLFILGCQSKAGSDTDTSTQDAGSLGIPSSMTPTPAGVPSTPAQSVPALPGVTEQNANQENPSNLNGTTTTSNWLDAFKNVISNFGSFDPRSMPEIAKNPLRDWFCAIAQLNGLRALYGGTSVGEFVADLYVRVLRRAPDLGGQNFHVRELVNGTKTIRQKVRDFVLSDEHLRQQVVRLNYDHFLGRAPEQAGSDHWRNFLVQHDDQHHDPYEGKPDLGSFQAHLLASDEFYINRSGRDPRTHIINSYRYILGRWPAEWEIQWHLAANGDLNNHGVRFRAAVNFTASEEYRLSWLARLYVDYYGRPPTGPELNEKISLMRQGRDMFSIMTDLLANVNYLSRVDQLWQSFYNQQYCSSSGD